ncbi:hypothetical protein TYRP_007247 [Tyrophagus putrescentiae]|nr:hypothetical protein TYRP_007247 [Tyrophagus putrescentiae]
MHSDKELAAVGFGPTHGTLLRSSCQHLHLNACCPPWLYPLLLSTVFFSRRYFQMKKWAPGLTPSATRSLPGPSVSSQSVSSTVLFFLARVH